MTSWKINGIDLDSLDFIDGLSFNVQNMDDDYVEIRLARNFDAELPIYFQPGQQVRIEANGSVVFSGKVDDPLFQGGGNAESQSIFAYGPWHFLSSRTLTYLYRYVNGSGTLTRGIIGGDAGGLVESILTTNAAADVQIGYVDLGDVYIPETEVVDVTVAEALRTVLRFVPGAIVCFDYSTIPPTFHALRPDSAYFLTVPINSLSGIVSDFRYRPLFSRVVDGVKLHYDAAGFTKTGTCDLRQSGYGASDWSLLAEEIPEKRGFYYFETHQIGNMSGRNLFHRTIQLSGVKEVTTYVWKGKLWTYVPYLMVTSPQLFKLDNLTVPVANTGTNEYNKQLMADRAMFTKYFSFGRASNVNFNLTVSTASEANAGIMTIRNKVALSDMGGSLGIDGAFRPVMLRGDSCDTRPSSITSLNNVAHRRQFIPKRMLQKTEGDGGIRAYAVDFIWNYTNTAGQVGRIENHEVLPDVWPVFLETSTLGTVDPESGEFTKTMTIENDTVESPIPVIADKILATFSRLFYDGGFSIYLEDFPGTFFGLGRRVAVSPGGFAETVQRFTLDSKTGVATVSFGVPNHLGPQDLLALYRASRK